MSMHVAAGPGIARGLLRALRPALAPGASTAARATARDVAQVMGLGGLDAALAGLERHRDRPLPADLAHVLARLARLAEQAEREDSALPFVSADAELGALARALDETDWAGSGGAAVTVHRAIEVLADLPLEPNPDLARARLTAPVAASLRAALDWIGADEALLVQGAVQDSALSLTCPVAHEGGLGPAGAVLGAVEGSLGSDADGRWTLRVPLHVERPSFLLLRVGHVPIALPWHTVARMRMLPAADWAAQREGLLDPLTATPAGQDERPGALVALGLARGWLLADRVVWRIAAAPENVDERGPFAASTRVVSIENGERYWVLEPSWLLRNVAPEPVAPPAPRRRAPAPAAAEVLVPLVESPEAPAAAEATASPAPAPPSIAPAAEPVAAEAPVAEARASEAPAEPQASLADAVARAIEKLRAERASAPPPAGVPAPAPATAPAPAPAPPPPSRSMSMPPVPPASRELPRPSSQPLPRPVPPPSAPSRMIPRPPSHAHLTVLRPADVRPLGTPPPSRELPRPAPAAEAAAAVPAQAPTAPVSPPAPPAPVESAASEVRESSAPAGGDERPSGAHALPARRALVADDSLVARIFLARLLERRGFIVELVGDGEGLWDALARGPWALVCADVSLPDSWGRAHLERLLDFRAACREPFRLVVLTRDAAEEREAAEAGAVLHLRKPFDPSNLDQLLGR